QPLTDLEQYCTNFELTIAPRAKVFNYVDRFGNSVHHFSVIPEHPDLVIAARSTVVTVRPADPTQSADASRRALVADAQLVSLYDYLQPSPLVEFGVELTALSS